MSIDQLYFTRCASDKGRERIDGFQVKACSEGITGETEKRIRFFSQQYHWPSSLDPLVRPGPMAVEDFTKFPISLHYYRVPDGRYGLTRTCIAPVQPNRAGVFFAHTLVFSPEALEPVSYNPFALARSDIFQQQDDSSRTELPVLDDFSKVVLPEDKKCWSVAATTPYSERLAPLVDALSTDPSGRSVIILPSSLQDAWGLVEAVLLLVPGRFRVGIEFSVYEPDPYRVRKTGPEDMFYEQKLITTSPRQEGGKFQFRPDEYAGHYYVFNFAELRFSNFPAPSVYVQRVAADCGEGRLEEVFRLQSWLSRLKLDTEIEKWSSILDAIDYFEPSEHRPKIEMRVAIEALVSTCRSSIQAEAAVAAMVDMLVTVAGACPESDLVTAFSSIGMLIHRTDTPDKVEQDAARKLSETVTSLLIVGRVICVQSASKTLGAPGRIILGQAVEGLVLREGALTLQAASPADMGALPEILDQGLHALFEGPDKSRVKVLLPEALLFADRVGCLAALWSRLKLWLMSEFLDTLPATEVAELLPRIEAAVSGNKCPQVWLDLLRWQLFSTSVPTDLKTSSITNLAAACRASNNPSQVTKDVIEDAVKQLDELSYLLFLETLTGDFDDEVTKMVERVYDEYLTAVPEQDRWKLRCKMAGENANLVNREFVRTVWPWSEEQGQEKLDKWMDEIFTRFPDANNVVAEKLAALAAESQGGNAVAPLLSAYLLSATKNKIDQQGQGARAIVAQALVTMIPLNGMSASLSECLNTIDRKNWPPHDAVRLDLMQEMAIVTQMYEVNQELSFAELMKQRPQLLEIFKSVYLESTEREQALIWVIKVALKGAGIGDVQSAQTLLEVALILLGKREQNHLTRLPLPFGELLSSSLNQVDLVKRVMALAQFAQWANVNNNFAGVESTRFVAEILRQMSGDTKNALWDYLEHRYSSSAWNEFLYNLREMTNGRTMPPQTKELPAKLKAPAPYVGMMSNIFGKLSGAVRGLWGTPKVEHKKASGRQRPKDVPVIKSKPKPMKKKRRNHK